MLEKLDDDFERSFDNFEIGRVGGKERREIEECSIVNQILEGREMYRERYI